MRKWTDDQQALRFLYRSRFAQWGEGHLERDRAGEFAWEPWKRVAESGLFGVPFDVQFGGLGKDLLTTLYLLEELGYQCRDSGLNFSISTHIVSCGVPLQRFASPELKGRYLPRICDGSLIGAHAITEPGGGSDAMVITSRAIRRNGGFVLNGHKCFISSAPVADLILLYVRTSEKPGPFGLTVFAVERDTPGLQFGPPVEKMGLRTSPMGAVTFEDCYVPESAIVGKVGHGFRVLDYVMRWEILCAFMISLGSMRHRMERCIDYARTRSQFGSSIGSYQRIANRIVDMKIGYETATRWLFDTAERVMADEEVLIDMAIAKLLASEANLKSAQDAVQIFGGRGYLHGYGLEKDLRDATAGTIYSGTSEIQQDKIARLLGVH